MKYSPKYFNEFKKRYPGVARSFDQLGAECAKAGPIDEKTQHLIKLGVATALGHEAMCRSWQSVRWKRRKPGCNPASSTFVHNYRRFSDNAGGYAVGGRGIAAEQK